MNDESFFNPFSYCQKMEHHNFPAQVKCEKSATNLAHCVASHGYVPSVLYILSLVFAFCNI